MALDWDDLKTVMHLVRGGSLAAAAEALGINYTTVARRITRVEKALNMVLFERLADGYRPTEAARIVAQQAAAMEAHEFDLMRALGKQDTSLQGPLVITAPELLCATILPPILDRFSTEYPEIRLEVRASTDILDLNRREADLAIRISNDPGDQLMGVRLTAQDTASFASRDLARRLEANPEGVIDWIVYSGHAHVPQAALQSYPNARIRMQFDDMIGLLGAARAGLGVVRMPMFLGRSHKELVQVPMLPPQPYLDIWVVAHKDVWPTARVTAFRKHLIPSFKASRAMFVA